MNSHFDILTEGFFYKCRVDCTFDIIKIHIPTENNIEYSIIRYRCQDDDINNY